MGIKATFIGKTSLVFIKNQQYKLRIKNYNSMELELIGSNEKIVYGSLSAFLRN